MINSKKYTRQIALPEIGISGQEKLSNAKVLIIGAGGLGCPVLQNLAAAGVGSIGIVDGDSIEETNLHRQHLYTLNDCGKNKAEVALDAISKLNPDIIITAYPCHFTSVNALEMASSYQLIVDCTDTIATRYLINDVALIKGIPMVYASIHKFEGQLSVFNYHNGPSYRCLFPEPENSTPISNCNDAGVLGVLSNTLGVLQATEVLKIILEIGEILSGKILIYDGLYHKMQTIDFKKNHIQIEKGIQNGLSISHAKEVGSIVAADFFETANNAGNLIVDLRESYEEPKLNLPNIQCVPVAELESFLKDTDRNQKIILFCEHGNTSFLAANYLIKKEFQNVFHLKNGIKALQEMNTNRL